MTTAISTTDLAGTAAELAVLMLDNESNQAESARLARDAARESYLANARAQIDALHAAADATRTGAIVSGSLTLAGGAFGTVAALSQYSADTDRAKIAALDRHLPCNTGELSMLERDAASAGASATILKTAGDNLIALATPLKQIVGDSTAQGEQAEAKRYETAAEQAKWQAGDASSELDKADKNRDKALDLLQGIQGEQHTSNNAIIGRI